MRDLTITFNNNRQVANKHLITLTRYEEWTLSSTSHIHIDNEHQHYRQCSYGRYYQYYYYHHSPLHYYYYYYYHYQYYYNNYYYYCTRSCSFVQEEAVVISGQLIEVMLNNSQETGSLERHSE